MTSKPCGCGCGELIPDRGANGKVRKFVYGHTRRLNPREFEERDAGFTTPCWIWLRGCNTQGYGIAWRGKNVPAHIASYRERVGPIPPGLQLDHKCRNRNCVNPEHLEPVTQKENIRRGLLAKLTREKAQEIVTRFRAGEKAIALAKEFGIGRCYVNTLERNNIWEA